MKNELTNSLMLTSSPSCSWSRSGSRDSSSGSPFCITLLTSEALSSMLPSDMSVTCGLKSRFLSRVETWATPSSMDGRTVRWPAIAQDQCEMHQCKCLCSKVNYFTSRRQVNWMPSPSAFGPLTLSLRMILRLSISGGGSLVSGPI